MKIFSAKQLYEADAITLEKQGIQSIDLMERAATQIFNWLHQRMQGAQVPIHIFCGIGNNGGDGLALGRLLIENGYNATLYVANFTDKRSPCFLTNYNRVKAITKKWPILMTSENDFPNIHADDIIVDALFGIGLNRAPEGWVKLLIQYLNQQQAFRLSVDIPSGLSANEALLDSEAVIKANHTLTFQAPKLTFFLPETGRFVPYFEVLDIGLDPEYLMTALPLAQLIYKPQAQQFYKQREKFAHKGAFGHVLVVGGSKGKMGAVSLSAKAALKVGAGLVTAFVPACGNDILQVTVPEVMTLPDAAENHLTNITLDWSPSVIAVGMGMGQHPDSVASIENLLTEKKLPYVVDADALNVLSIEKKLLKLLPENTILTPHEGELKRLLGPWKNDFEKLEKAKKFSGKHKVILLLKGAHSVVIYHDKMYINTNGNPGMATAGSGDVLSGLIAGLCAQGYDPLLATVFGVYLHGSAGDIAANQLGFEAMMASDIIANIGSAFLNLFQQEQLSQESESEPN
ncbi:MAG TPA: NAD(P)H-hydrate dehydratase [Flavobacteriaceae bacterium]|nr:NAD(P)H-hydrate dehydratase [Flavobacteriaceae bacterium]MCB9213318.1 NAD(P)H-hydrate dehydratase [Alteromonas sp.]HPF10208.1 NAD(P)H-hydrate dehydratase [Flavobacteriaceae bacterium]HQU20654.1 NAD(P)H-hydrate dehydratase [Flavobacteriaceae bacterium]HQU64928.1 NAD(P)H-hydrate dehydratase [Flavobacteriaceae bacterium]